LFVVRLVGDAIRCVTDSIIVGLFNSPISSPLIPTKHVLFPPVFSSKILVLINRIESRVPVAESRFVAVMNVVNRRDRERRSVTVVLVERNRDWANVTQKRGIRVDQLIRLLVVRLRHCRDRRRGCVSLAPSNWPALFQVLPDGLRMLLGGCDGLHLINVLRIRESKFEAPDTQT